MTETAYRPELPEPPPRIAKLRTHRGYPVPWFVADIDGVPDFRIMDEHKIHEAIRFDLCWLCGQKTGSHVAFVVGPMCAVNRTSAEPPSHRDCAEYAVKACPFLVRPHAKRREHDLEQLGVHEPAGVMLRRNPGVSLLWITRRSSMRYRPAGLFYIGEPDEVGWYAEGREATHDEILESIETGLPALAEMAKAQGRRAERALERQLEQALTLLPA